MPSETQLREFAEFAGNLADAGGAIIRKATREPFHIEMKDDGSPVTAVDKSVEDRLREIIAETYPDHGVLGEERAATAADSEFVWVIDPIDGTLPFLAGLPVFGTLLALVHDETPVIGIIDMPMTHERWVGLKDRPTTRNGDPIRVRECAHLSEALMSTSNPDFYGEGDRPALNKMTSATRWRVYGGSCMAYAQIATGRIDLGMDVGFDIHDYLALDPVIRGAGGAITDWTGAPLTVHSGDRLLAAGDPRVHAQALDILAKFN
jgi:histidinol phosphatase-like enzyme (inositol monophosphatase family)